MSSMIGDDFNFNFQQDPKEELNRVEIEQIQMMAWDFFSAYKMGDQQRCVRIFQIICDMVDNKEGLVSLQEYYKGRKISIYKGRVDLRLASKYIAFVASTIKELTDWRVKPTAIE